MLSLGLKGLIGGVIVVLISLISKTKHFYLAAFLPLFPTFTIFAHYFIGTNKSPTDLKEACIFGIASCFTLIAYILSVYYFADKLPIIKNILASLVVWLLSSGLLLLAWNKFYLKIP